MARFNIRKTRPPVTSPVKTFADSPASPAGPDSPASSDSRSTRTHQGGQGYLRDEKSELFLLAVTNMVGQRTFYELVSERDGRFTALIGQLAVEDPQWVAGLLRWLRGEGQLRTAALVGAAEFAKARLAAGAHGYSRQVVDSVLQRPDEPGELLAYWMSTHGRAIPKPVKRGVADAVRRLYHERALLKYDTDSRDVRFGDVLELVHASPAPDKAWQSDLFRHAIDRRHGRGEDVPDSLPTLKARARLMARPVGQRRQVLDTHQRKFLRAAGMTWEALAGWLQGPMDKRAWEAVIPEMGGMALLRNLRNFDEAGISDSVAATVAAKLADAHEVARARQLPFRYLAAYRAVPSLRWGHALERALGHSLANVPSLPGRSLILVDRSGSMFGPVSERTQLNRADSAAIFGTALATRAVEADLVQFGSTSARVELRGGESVLRTLERFDSLGGTSTARAVRQHYRGQDRVVIVTDEQVSPSQYGSPAEQVPGEVPVYTWNLAGYRTGHGPSGAANRHTFGGLTDAAFRMIPLLEAGRDAHWPWQR